MKWCFKLIFLICLNFESCLIRNVNIIWSTTFYRIIYLIQNNDFVKCIHLRHHSYHCFERRSMGFLSQWSWRHVGSSSVVFEKTSLTFSHHLTAWLIYSQPVPSCTLITLLIKQTKHQDRPPPYSYEVTSNFPGQKVLCCVTLVV